MMGGQPPARPWSCDVGLAGGAAQQQASPAGELARDRPIEATAKANVTLPLGLSIGQFIRVPSNHPRPRSRRCWTAPDGRPASLYHSELRPDHWPAWRTPPASFVSP